MPKFALTALIALSLLKKLAIGRMSKLTIPTVLASAFHVKLTHRLLSITLVGLLGRVRSRPRRIWSSISATTSSRRASRRSRAILSATLR